MVIRRSATILIASFSLAGCAKQEIAASRTIPLKDALSIVETEVRDTYPVSLADIGTANNDNIKKALIQAQCFSKTANPVVPVVTGVITIGLQGSIGQQGGIGLSGVTNASGATLSYQITQGEQQSLTVPVTFVSLKGLAYFYLAQNMANLSNLTSADPIRRRITAEVVANTDELSEVADDVITNYASNTTSCPPDSSTPGSEPAMVPLRGKAATTK